MTDAATPRLYNVAQACAALGDISRGTFYNLVRAGKIKTVKVGKRTFVTDRGLQEFIDGLESSALKLTERQMRALRRRQLKTL